MSRAVARAAPTVAVTVCVPAVSLEQRDCAHLPSEIVYVACSSSRRLPNASNPSTA